MAYKWNYCSLGGVTRVKIETGEDIAHLGELDQKLWTVLSCPTTGLEFDDKTLSLMDTDADGKIRVKEVVEATQWATSVLKDKDFLLKGESTLPLGLINTDSEEGAKLEASAKKILANLGLEKDSIDVTDADNGAGIFAKTRFNGDGIVIPASAEEEGLQKLIATIVEKSGSVADRSGEAGVNADIVEKFYAACADWSAWKAAAETGKESIFPYGDSTGAALAACEAIQDKVADYFMRCKLIAFDDACAPAVDLSVEKIGAIRDKNLSICPEEVAECPLARPCKEAILPFNAINPAWQASFDAVKNLVLDVDFKDKDGITEAEWQGMLSKFDAYKAWKGAEKGSEVESLGVEGVAAILEEDRKADLLDLIAKDEAFKDEAASIDAVGKLLRYCRDLYAFLKNYVTFNNFYGRSDKVKAVFEAGKLYIDERCCNLCIKVSGVGNHAEAAQLSGAFLIYCTCKSAKLGKSMDIVAIMTDGRTRNLRPGKNGIFYDLDGNDWDAVITKVVENPISVRQAFWNPYRKLAKFISDKIDKSASDKDAAATSDLLAKADTADPTTPKQPFDISKFAGIFAAVGLAIGALGAGLGLIISGLKGLAWWKYLVIIAVIMLIISGPACFIAWRKLRKRDLGPVLNANGWAVNAAVLVNILFGKTLTSVAKYPAVKGNDPFKKRTPVWLKILRWFLLLAAIAFGVLYFTDNLGSIGLPRHKAEPEPVEECCCCDSCAVNVAEIPEEPVETAE